MIYTASKSTESDNIVTSEKINTSSGLYYIELGVELIAITDVYPLKIKSNNIKIDTEYFELIKLKRAFFNKVMTFGEGSLKWAHQQKIFLINTYPMFPQC